jgi:hypothetical protein
MQRSGYRQLMSIVTRCTAPGCETLTMGRLCIEHEALPKRVFVRGRPFTRRETDLRRLLSAPFPARPSVVRTASERLAAAPHLR